MFRILFVCAALAAAFCMWCGLADAAERPVITNESQENTLDFWAGISSPEKTRDEMLQQMCNESLTAYFYRRTQIESDAAQAAFQQASPEVQFEIRCKLGLEQEGCPE